MKDANAGGQVRLEGPLIEVRCRCCGKPLWGYVDRTCSDCTEASLEDLIVKMDPTYDKAKRNVLGETVAVKLWCRPPLIDQ